MSQAYLGIDIGAETVKIAELIRGPAGLRPGRTVLAEHRKAPAEAALKALRGLDGQPAAGAAVTGRMGQVLRLEKIPVKGAQTSGLELLLPETRPVALISIGSRGFSVLELREGGSAVFRSNSRCSQGTGNFLRQLVERFGLSVEEAAVRCADVQAPSSLSGRCPVILKTDMTHLANQGQDRDRILAGLFDAICENVQVLIKPRLTPPRVLLSGGVSRAPRIREHFRRFLREHAMELLEPEGVELLFVDAFGAAAEAARRGLSLPPLEHLAAPPREASFVQVPPLREALEKVHRLHRPAREADGRPRPVLLGLDMGSTGSKAVALDAGDGEVRWQAYRNTTGDPVGAARALVRRFLDEGGGRHDLRAFGVTGSGREIVGSLLATCYGPRSVFVLNEIAAHARGATHHDPDVDTIFEIGGQDAKYIRLNGGQVVEAAMNEACSAGTGSFIEEQGGKFADVENVVQMGRLALEADRGISLGQHCSVFMAEVIDAALSAGHGSRTILAGIYDSIIQNYLNRVKGNRSVGRRIFCQGMPFASDALAAAVARQTGRDVVVPPDPGTVGALGIALLARQELSLDAAEAGLDAARFLEAAVLGRDRFPCPSNRGCGGAGNRCRIHRLTTQVAGRKQTFLWGGNCSLYDRGAGRRKLPDRAPDPFEQRQAFVRSVIEETGGHLPGRQTVAMTDEFVLKNLFPFFATFVRELGFNLRVLTGGDQRVLKRGIEESNVPACAPLQLAAGLAAELVDEAPDILFLPMLRDLPRTAGEAVSATCPLSQAGPDLFRLNFAGRGRTRFVSPVIDMGPGNLGSPLFRESCRRTARLLGAGGPRWRRAYGRARQVQEAFQAHCLRVGREALAFCAEKGVVPVVVLGRAYTLYNDLLNANVPALLREQGAVGIPVDCTPVDGSVPVFREVFWGYSQTNLRAAHHVRSTPGLYSVFCSNYSCGPDSFNLHFYAYIMDGKPFAVIETDGHSGDAGTQTRIEAFLYCVEADRRAGNASQARARKRLRALEEDRFTLEDVKRTGRLLLIPAMGPNARVAAAGLRAQGIRAEALPVPDHDAVRRGRKHTSGKECLPMTVTLGSVLQRVRAGGADRERYAFFMPATRGPCRFGMYNLLDKVVFERLGLQERVRVVSQPEGDFFQGVPAGAALRIWASFAAADLLEAMLHHVRPVEAVPGTAHRIYDDTYGRVCELLESSPAPGLADALACLPGALFGLRPLLARAAARFAAVKDPRRRVPTVSVVGEIYVRCDPFSNDFVIDRLERRGLRVRFAPFSEFIEYVDWVNTVKRAEKRHESAGSLLRDHLTLRVKRLVLDRLYAAVRPAMGWPRRLRLSDTLAAADSYLTPRLHGEAVLTLGGPLFEHAAGEILGVVNVGPLECMPTKVAEAQFFHAAERQGLLSLTLSLNGEPADPELLDNFAYEVHARFQETEDAVRTAASRLAHRAAPGREREERAGGRFSVLGLLRPADVPFARPRPRTPTAPGSAPSPPGPGVRRTRAPGPNRTP